MTLTKGNIIIEEIKVGDLHFEYELGLGMKLEVLTKPELNDEGNFVWNSKNLTSGRIVNYELNPKYPACYSVNLYDYEAYYVKFYI